MVCENPEVVAEFNIVSLGKHYSTDQIPSNMRDELAIAAYAIKKVKGIDVMVTGIPLQALVVLEFELVGQLKY